MKKIKAYELDIMFNLYLMNVLFVVMIICNLYFKPNSFSGIFTLIVTIIHSIMIIRARGFGKRFIPIALIFFVRFVQVGISLIFGIELNTGNLIVVLVIDLVLLLLCYHDSNKFEYYTENA